jgi:hypothetical protein
MDMGGSMACSKFNHKQIHGALQALAYWLGYERQRYRFFDLREIAIANELVHLLEPYIRQTGCYIDCEVPYKIFLSSSLTDNRKADIAIWSTADKCKNKHYEAIIELKRFKAPLKAIKADIDRIKDAVDNINGMTGLFIACSPGSICDEWINSSYHATRKYLYTNNTVYRIRRILHSYPFSGNPSAGFHVVLGEILGSKRQ